MALSPLQNLGRELARVAHSVIALDQFTGVVEADDDKTPSNRRAIDAVAKGGQRGRGEIILKESPRRGPPSWGPQCFFSAASILTRRHNDGPNSKLGSPTGAAFCRLFFAGSQHNQHHQYVESE